MKTVPGRSNQVGDSSRSEGVGNMRSSTTSKPKMGSHPCCILPIVVGVGTTIMFFVCYAIAVYNDHTVKNFPFISDTGVYPPERGIFTLSFNLSAFGGLVLMYLRYCYISQSDGPRKLNLFTFGCGVLVCLGLMMVGAFQWSDMLYPHMVGAVMAFALGIVYIWLDTILSYKQLWSDMLYPHMVGAVMAFALGIVYIWLDTILSYKLQPLSTSVWAFRARLLVATLATVSGGVMFVFGGIIFSRDDYPYAVRLAAVGGEWALGIGLLVYIVTLCAEIRKVRRIAVVMDISGRFDVSNTHELRASRVIVNHDIPE